MDGTPGVSLSGTLNQQLLRLAELVQLCGRAREASREELGFIIVNETVRLVDYDQAVLWDAGTGRIAAISGAERVRSAAPYVIGLNRLYKLISASGMRDAVHVPDPALVAKCGFDPESKLAPQCFWQPLRLKGETVAILLLTRRDIWTEAEAPLLDTLAGAYAETWTLAHARRRSPHRGRWRRIRRWSAALLGICLVAATLLPVRTSAIAPAEVVARAPAFIRAPFAGVVDSIEVAPNTAVKAGQILVRLDRRQLDAALRVAAKAVEVATAQYRQTTQEGITDPKAREQLVAARGRLDEARADYGYRRAMGQRADLPSPADGIAVFNDPAEWIGRPVETGERILQVSPPSSSRIEIELPVADAMTFADGAEVLFFSNVDPDKPAQGHVTFMSYATSLSPSGVLVYTVRADLGSESELRLGLKGTAKVFGEPRPFLLQLLRRPIAYLRELFA